MGRLELSEKKGFVVHKSDSFIYSKFRDLYWPIVFEENDWCVFKSFPNTLDLRHRIWMFHYKCNEDTSVDSPACRICNEPIPEKLLKTARLLDSGG